LSLLRNNSFILALAVAGGIVAGHGAAFTRSLVTPLLAIVMTLSLVGVSSDVFRGGAKLLRPGALSLLLNYGILGGAVGLACNLLLFAVKLTVGLLTGSIAVATDAVNNLSDSGSSLVTLFGFKMSGKPADAEHPYGHGRMEYISGLIVSFIILLFVFSVYE